MRFHMKAIMIYPGHALWLGWCNQVQEYNFSVLIFADRDTEQECPLDIVDTNTEMAARTVLDAVNLGIINDWRQLYG
ncbi:hypothetical protein vBKpnPBP5_4 [Klebsiella phage vB_KpnP_Bp5]|uniref:Uncharacterized protein n=1 Tax=Klebsiella phage vB_KpnP_Bp5 TaxID=2593329 RepID=A0A6M2YG20_9CAUD|nr:hypothetical protein vBKpnPBP5_4 [Klebsiella phage vB_KpnP_Bp5]